MSYEGKPPQVLAAQWENNRPALRAMGRKGQRVKTSHENQLKDLEAALKEERNPMSAKNIAALAAEQAKLYTTNPEGDVLPPDDRVFPPNQPRA